METVVMTEIDYCDIPGSPREPIFHGDYTFNTGKTKYLTVTDYVIFVATLVVSTAIGVYQAWEDHLQMGLDEYLLAGRSMTAIPVCMSLMASYLSGIAFTGVPAEVYRYNIFYVWVFLLYITTITAAVNIYMPVFYELGVTSIYEYLEMRFSRGVRTAASCIFVIHMVLYLSYVLYTPSIALNAATGFDLWLSVVSVAVVATFYTALGGMKAVIWTDVFQMVVMYLSLVVTLVGGALKVGGLNPVLYSARRTNRLFFLDFRVNPTVRHTVWGMIIGGFFTMTGTYATNQALVHRCLTCTSLKEAKRALWLNVPGRSLFLFLGLFIGLYISAFYERCDPLRAKLITNENQIVPFFMMDVLSDTVGLPGLVLAGIFSATLSSMSSGLNSISAVILEDYVKVYSKKRIRDNHARLYTQVIAVVIGVVCLQLIVLVVQMASILQSALSLQGVLGAPTFGLFSLGLLFPWANAKGAMAGLFGSLFFMVWIYLQTSPVGVLKSEAALACVTNCNISVFLNVSKRAWQKLSMPPELTNSSSVYAVSYVWYSLLGFALCVSIGLAVSYYTGFQDPQTIDPWLIVPVFDIAFPFLSESTRKYLRFGVDHKNKFEKFRAKKLSSLLTSTDQSTSVTSPHSILASKRVRSKTSYASSRIPAWTHPNTFYGETEV